MQWMWSDDLARLLIERGEASATQLQDWLDRPVGLSSEADPVEAARSMLATDARSSDSTSA
jgi:hypothetical protein